MSQTNSPLVALGIPSGDMVHADFAMSLANMCFNAGARAFLVNAKSSLVMVARNQIVEAAKLAKATHVLFLDSDLIFPVTTLSRLLAHGKDIVGGLYVQRVPPHRSLGEPLEGENASGGLRKMKSMPTGCLLIKLSVFDKLPKPWFNTKAEGEKILGEDYYFCANARSAGFEIWCDEVLSGELAHIGTQTFSGAIK